MEIAGSVQRRPLILVSLLLAAGSLSDRLGRKGFLLAGLVVFGAASIAGGLTDTAGQLIVARCFMGLGAAMIFPTTLSLISNVYTERAERAKAIGLWGATAGIAIALGPIVGGGLLEQFRWTSIFFAMAPVAAVAAALFAVFILRERSAAEPMLDVSLFRNLRFTAASGSVTIAFFGITGFSFLISQYFQFLKGYGPLSTGVRLLPVAFAVGIMSVLGTQLAVRFGTKQVVTVGLFFFAVFFAWVSTADTGTSYLEIVGQMLLGGSAVGLVSAPATEAIMGVVPKAKAGIGSAVNDATRLLGSTLGIAVIGSIYVSLYNNRLSDKLPAALTPQDARTAHDSVGRAFALANQTSGNGHPALADAVHAAASNAFFHGFSVGCLVAAGVSAVAAIATLVLLPAHPATGLTLALESE